MMKRALQLAALFMFFCPSFSAAAPPRPVVVVALDGSGDFGPQTPGTRTAGWQEALNYCVAHGRDLYIQGGFGGRQVYNIQETIHVPPAQDFRIDGGVYVLNWVGSQDSDLMEIDSSMNCEYHFGIMVYGGKKAGLRVHPAGPVPVDHFAVCVETHIEMEGLADPQPFKRGERRAGEGFVLDGTAASIVHSEFRLASVINFQTCIRSTGAVGYNSITCPHLHTNSDHGTLFDSDDRFNANTVAVTLGSDQGAEGVTGLKLAGKKNSIELKERESNRPIPKRRSVIFERTAAGNQVNLSAPPVSDPSEMITDRASSASNQVTWAGETPPITTLTTKAGVVWTYTQKLWPATIALSGGHITSVSITRGTHRVALNPLKTTEVVLSVGDTLNIDSRSAATVTVLPLKVR